MMKKIFLLLFFFAGAVTFASAQILVSGGGPVNYTISPYPGNFTNYYDGFTVLFKANMANTGGATMAIGAGAPVNIANTAGNPLSANDIKLNQIVMLVYESAGSRFQMISTPGNMGGGGGSGWDILGNSGTTDGTHFVGNTDDKPLSFRVNNQRSGYITNGNGLAFFGYQAGLNNGAGINNSALGYQALYLNGSGNENSAIGHSALWNNSSGSGNVALGKEAMWNNSTGNFNTAVGTYALRSNNNNYNIAIGYSAMYLNGSGQKNQAIGANALFNNASGSSNVAIGDGSLYGITNGSNNIGIGEHALNNNINGTGNVAIGYQAGYFETGSNKLYISNNSTTTPLIGGDFAATQVDINGQIKITGGSPANGKVLTSDATGLATWQTPSGGITGGGTASYIPKWQTASTLTTSVMFDDGTNIGIGTTAPSSLLHVNGIEQLGTISATTGQLKFFNSATAFSTSLQANPGSNVTYTLPTDAPVSNGFVLSSTTTGIWSWADPATLPVAARWDLLSNPTGALTLSHGTNSTTFNFANIGTTAFTMNATAMTTGALLSLNSTNATATGNALLVSSNSTGAEVAGIARYNFTGAHTNTGFQIDDVSATGTVVAVNPTALTTGTGLLVNSSNAAATGNALYVTSNSTGAQANGIARFNFTGAHTNNGLQINDVSATGTVVVVNPTALTTGVGLAVNSSNAAATGNAFYVTSASTGAAANGIARFNFTGAHTNNGLQINDVSATGTVVVVNPTALTTGVGLAVNSSNAAATGNAFLVTSASTGAEVAGISRLNFTGAHTNNGFQIDDVTTAGTAVKINANALVGGTGLSVSSTATGLTGLFSDFTLSGNNVGNTGTVFRAATTGAANAVTVGMISNAGTGLSFRVNDNGTDTDPSPFVVDAAGNVGIGMTTPSRAVLEVSGMVGNCSAIFGTNSSGISVGANWPGVGFNNYLNGVDKTIAAGYPGAITYSQTNGDFIFFLGPSAGSADANSNLVERLRILNNGNMGIGTPAPASALHVNGAARFGFASATTGSQIWQNAANANTITINSGVTATSYTLALPTAQGAASTFLQNDGAGNLSWAAGGGGGVTGGGTANYLTKWQTASTLTASVMYDDGANIGIGTGSPVMKLDVTDGATTAGYATIRGASTGNALVFGVLGNISSTTANASGVRGVALATSGATNGVWGDNPSTTNTATGVFGTATATSGQVYGVYGASSSTSAAAAGVVGFALATTGQVYGVNGQTNSTSGIGVLGNATTTTGSTYGVYGQNASASGRGVLGFATSATGNTYGVSGQTSSDAGTGVLGTATSATGNVTGVWGNVASTSAGATALYGTATGASGSTYGVWGTNTSSTGYGVYGQNTSAAGVNYGVVGDVASATAYAGYFIGGRNYFQGNVGIGIPAPLEKLDVVGNVQFTGALMPNSTAGTSGQALISQGAGSAPQWQTFSGVLAGGTVNYMPKWTSATTLSSTSKIYDDGTNVGIRTTAPSFYLDARGSNPRINTAFENIFQIGSTDASPNTLAMRFGIQTHGTATSRNAQIEVDDGGTKRDLLIQPNGGNIGIGVTSALFKVDALDAVNLGAALHGKSTGTNGSGVYGEATNSNGTGVYGSATAGALAGVYGQGAGTANSAYFTGGAGAFVQDKLGIGVQPNAALDISGEIDIRKSANLATLIAGANNDIAIGPTSFVKITTTAGPFSISGFATGKDGKMLIVYNATGQNMTIQNLINSAAPNQIDTNTGANVITTGNGAATFIYDSSVSKWILISVQQ